MQKKVEKLPKENKVTKFGEVKLEEYDKCQQINNY